MVNTLLLTPADHLVVVQPNYATNIEVPKAIGCSISFVNLAIENNWHLSIDDIAKAIQPNTKLISITSPHNPSGMVLSYIQLSKIIQLAEEKNIYLLVDETYRDICFATPYPLAASLSNKVISISSVSKAYGLPGIRLGWLVTKDQQLFEKLLAAKEMIYITNSVLDEEACYAFLQKKDQWVEIINKKAQENLQIVKEWFLAETRLRYVLPAGGVVCFPAIKEEVEIDLNLFYSTLMKRYKTMVGPGHWFNMPDKFMRIGFAWIDEITLKKGLENISSCLDECVIG
jgi:aspartate/methionine/tyrosine aminotransferase